MKTKKYVGQFISAEGDNYTLEVNCFGFLQAFFLLTADAIRSGRHYQLHQITNEDGTIALVDDILKCGNLLTI